MGVEKLAPPGFDPRTTQPVASHFTDCTILALGSTCHTTIPNTYILLLSLIAKRNVWMTVNGEYIWNERYQIS
jgi:hypothetical protein